MGIGIFGACVKLTWFQFSSDSWDLCTLSHQPKSPRKRSYHVSHVLERCPSLSIARRRATTKTSQPMATSITPPLPMDASVATISSMDASPMTPPLPTDCYSTKDTTQAVMGLANTVLSRLCGFASRKTRGCTNLGMSKSAVGARVANEKAVVTGPQNQN
ncbi:hypothetical protein BC940DRAFT_296635 [Gongronella butleri]|nr:hypothetical protein BC940DRAFT_296635 [Gongronella butleri]